MDRMRQTAGAVLVAALCGTQIPLVRQPGKGGGGRVVYWKLPGGKVELGETPAQAAARELCEETGIHVKSEDFVELDETEQTGRSGKYPQWLLGVTLTREQVAEHDGKVVTLQDEESETLESTLFDIDELDRMVDFMPKHKSMMYAIRPAAPAPIAQVPATL